MTYVSPALDTTTLLAALNWRYATKKFDPAKKIPDETWRALEQALVLAPSSFGLQPWKFLVIADPALRARLRPHANDQAQVTDASHYVVLAMMKNLRAEHVDRWVRRVAEVRHQPLESLEKYREHIVGGLIDGYRSLRINTWASGQVYIALGTLLVSAAALKVDACPMEGFDARAFDEVLGLGKRGLSAAVTCALGYRSEARLPVRGGQVRARRESALRARRGHRASLILR
ncbi:MAG: NAD(P)H-dependent oxidoreductase [Verrucomicrobiota bacterium]